MSNPDIGTKQQLKFPPYHAAFAIWAGPAHSLEEGHNFTPGGVFLCWFFVGFLFAGFLRASTRAVLNRSSWRWIGAGFYQKCRDYCVK